MVEPCDKERIEPARVYAAPANYHMLVERDGTIGLSVDERVNWSRPSIDVLFESAASPGEEGWSRSSFRAPAPTARRACGSVKAAGGLTIAQDPHHAGYPVMPQAAIDAGAVDEVLRAEEIGRLLAELGAKGRRDRHEMHNLKSPQEVTDMTEKQKILIVDDKKENLVALRQVLRGVDAEVIEAEAATRPSPPRSTTISQWRSWTS